MILLVPVSESKASLTAAQHAISALLDTSDEIILVNVQPLLPSYVARFTSRAARDGLRAQRSARAFADARAALEQAGVRYRTVNAAGHVPGTIARLVDELGAHQIIVGATRRAGWWQALFSPVPRLIDLASVPVVIISDGRSGVFERYGLPACVGLGLTALAIAVE
jgi:nucleotide-binding universal stress UspA family protein